MDSNYPVIVRGSVVCLAFTTILMSLVALYYILTFRFFLMPIYDLTGTSGIDDSLIYITQSTSWFVLG